MFAKLLKYDFKAIFRYWWIGAVSMLVLAIPTGICGNLLMNGIYTDLVRIFCILWLYVYYFLTIIFSSLGSILIFVRYYSNFFRDEGYLTFTLPVKRSSLYFSKLLSGLFITMLSGLTVFVALGIILTIVPIEKGGSPASFAIIDEIISILQELLLQLNAGDIIWLLFSMLLCGVIWILVSVFSLSLTYLFITIGGALVKKYKLIATIGICYASSFVSSFVITPIVFMVTFWFTSLTEISNIFLYETPVYVESFILLILIFVIAVLMTLINFISLVINGMLERKLNLQ